MWQRLRWLGLRRLLHDLGQRRGLIATQRGRGVPDDLVDAAVSLELATNTYRGDRAEMAGLHRGLRDAAELTRPLGDVALVVITAGPMPGTERERAWEPAWLPLQADLVAQSTRGRQVRADHAGHHVHRDDPDLVTRVITDVGLADLSSTRTGRGLRRGVSEHEVAIDGERRRCSERGSGR